MKSLSRSYTAARVIETLENYARADDPLVARTEPRYDMQQDNEYIFNDEEFWRGVFYEPEQSLNRHYTLVSTAAISEWVPRVPGLYWRPESRQIRRLNRAFVERTSDQWEQYTPGGKSRKVLGGVGALRLPPSEDQYRLVSLTTTLNSSAAIPLLISPDVWETYRMREGVVVYSVKCRWQAMARRWAEHFPSVKGIPRGYLVLNVPSDILVSDMIAPTQIHPFTIMEYTDGSAEFFDFVYAGQDSGDPNYRQKFEQFFESYRTDNGRFGRYLLAGDMTSPLWDAVYSDPAALRRGDAAAESQLALLEARVYRQLKGDETIDLLLRLLCDHIDRSDQLTQLSDEVGVPPSIWFRGGTVAEASSQLVNEAMQRSLLPALIERCGVRFGLGNDTE